MKNLTRGVYESKKDEKYTTLKTKQLATTSGNISQPKSPKTKTSSQIKPISHSCNHFIFPGNRTLFGWLDSDRKPLYARYFQK